MAAMKPPVIEEQVIPELFMKDITDDNSEMHMAYELIGESYKTFSSQNLETGQIIAELCSTFVEPDVLCRTLAVYGENPNTIATEMLGTIRLIASKVRNTHVMEAMHLMYPGEGWKTFQFSNYDPQLSIEFGRVAIRQSCRYGIARKHMLHHLIIKTLFEAGYHFAVEQLGRPQGWAIIPRTIVKILASSKKLKITRVPDMKINLASNLNLILKYDRYWIHGEPDLYLIGNKIPEI